MRCLPIKHSLAVLVVLAAGADHAAGDSARGKRLFLQCAICHAAEPNVHKAGPSLARVYGRGAGMAEGYSQYSKALARSGIVWTERALDAWLRDPKALIAGNKMYMPGIRDPQTRRNIIAYLKELAAQNAAGDAARPGSGAAERRP